MKTVLVLGGAGFLGRNLIPKLLERGYEVNSVDPAYEPGCRSPEMHSFKYPERFETFQSIAGTYDLVFHLAASLTKHNIDERNKMGMEAFSDTQLDYEVARYLERYPPRERVVWMSSSATDAKDTENYAFVKYVSERFGRQLGKMKVPISILRPYGGYGPGQSLSYPMPAIIDRALRLEDPLIVWGNATTVRDWIFVSDVVDALLMAADGAFPHAGAIPIGTGRGVTYGALAAMIAKQVGYEPKIKIDFTKPVGSSHRVAVTGIAEAYGFKPKVTLEEGLAKCIAAAQVATGRIEGGHCPWCHGAPHAPSREKCEEYRLREEERKASA